MAGSFEHTYHMSYLITQARTTQRSIVITLLDFKNAFGEVHHNLITDVLSDHHIPPGIGKIIKHLCTNFFTFVSTSEYTTELLPFDKLPLHPKYKILIYSRYVLSKLSWHLTVADLPKTWVENNLDNLCYGYLRCWPEMPISGTFNIISLPRSKFGLNIVPISTKFI